MKREALTPETVTDPKTLIARIAADRAQGYSLVDREAEPHFRSLSVPVRRYDDVMSRPSTWAPISTAYRQGELVDRFLPLLREGADSVRSQLL